MNNKDKIVNFLALSSPKRFTNADIRAGTSVRPHQQVFQITRGLMKAGHICGQQLGREWHFWIDSPGKDRVKERLTDASTDTREKVFPSLKLSTNTLLLLPCSGAKRAGSERCADVSIIDTLNPALAAAFGEARISMRDIANINEQTLMPAYRRYCGHLYEQCATFLDNVVRAGPPVLILSGGYGLLRADESIGMYEKVFKVSNWPKGLLEACILDYARHAKIESVIAVMSHSTDYAKLVRRVNWRQAGLTATLVSPISVGGGAMVKVPRAQGQAIAQLIEVGLDDSWKSSESLSLRIENL